MADYNLGVLSYLEFELLIRDLLQEEWSVTLESFKSGKDRGIDIRYIKDGTTVIQCKHFFESTYANLKSHLNKEEKEKVEKLKPERYILATSVELSPDRKEELKEIFYPFCKKDSDILGREDILNFLNRHEKIVKRHYKLWFPGTVILQEVLEKIVHSENYAKTKMDLQEFQENIPKIVITKSFREFEKILDEHNVCVICGSPGSGKTTMTKFFVLNYIERGYQPIMITENINEAFRMFKPEEPQIFYYDDFLGQTFLEDNFLKNEDSQILLFIERNKNQKNKKFILATREYILNQAEMKSDKIKRVDDYKFILNCSNFSEEEKARILYNHLWHSQIEPKNIEVLINDKNYLKIVNHKNFNPRLIEEMTKTKNVNCENFIETFFQTLDNPADVWKDVFEHKISSHAQNILLILGSYRWELRFNHLWVAFNNLYFDSRDYQKIELHRSFKNSLHELEDTFIKLNSIGESKTISIEFSNPSIRDFVQNYLLDEKIILNKLCERAVDFYQLDQIWNLLQKNCREKTVDSAYVVQHIDPSIYLQTLEKIFLIESDSYPAFEDKILHLMNVTIIIRDSAYSDSLKHKLRLLIQRNYEGKTWRFDPLYNLLMQIESNEELLPIKILFFEELLKSTKCAILKSQPIYIDNFKLIKKFIQNLGLYLNHNEMNDLKTRLNSILSEGIEIDKDFTIFTFNPDEKCFDSVGFKIEGLEELKEDLEEISVIFGSCVQETLYDIHSKIENYYASLDVTENDEKPILKVNTDFEQIILNDENEIDIMFESLRNK